jgi:hypothetical protein
LLKDVGQLDGGVDGAGGLEQCLKAHYLFGKRETGAIEGIGLFGEGHEIE